MRFPGFILFFVLLAVAMLCHADEVTPSGGQPPVSSDTAGESDLLKVSFEQEMRELTSVYQIQLTDSADVVQNSYNWKGPDDASLRCDIGFTPAAVVIRAEYRDDCPFQQTMLRPSMPDWWRITYGADGVEFIIDDPTSAAQRVQFALNFSSQAVDPSVDLIDGSAETVKGPIHSADFKIEEIAGGERNGTKAYELRAAIPCSALADPKFFTGPLRIGVRLHDMDGGPSTYLMMEKRVETRPSE